MEKRQKLEIHYTKYRGLLRTPVVTTTARRSKALGVPHFNVCSTWIRGLLRSPVAGGQDTFYFLPF